MTALEPTVAEWLDIAHKYARNFDYTVREVKNVWFDPHTGAILYEVRRGPGWWQQLDNGSAGTLNVLPPGALRLVVRDGVPAFEPDPNSVQEAWKKRRRRQIEQEARDAWQPPSFWQSDAAAEMKKRLEQEGLA